MKLKKRRLYFYLITTLHDAMDRYKDGYRLFLEAYRGRTRGSGHKLQEGKFQVGIKKIFFIVREVKP